MEFPTRMYCYAQNMDRKKFIADCTNDFLSSGHNQLMLIYRIGVSERDARYITKKIVTLVETENLSLRVQMYTDIVPEAFAGLCEIQKQQEQGIPMDMNAAMRKEEKCEERRVL